MRRPPQGIERITADWGLSRIAGWETCGRAGGGLSVGMSTRCLPILDERPCDGNHFSPARSSSETAPEGPNLGASFGQNGPASTPRGCFAEPR
jgi:hypothetical protein